MNKTAFSWKNFPRPVNRRPADTSFTGDYFPEMDRTASRPWKSKQYPRIVAWLKANDRPLDLVVEATKRPCYFAPLMVRKEKDLPEWFDSFKPGLQSCRGLANALAIPAMGRLGEGRYKEAGQDLLACHRLGQLVARGGTMVECLVGVAADTIASYRDVAFLSAAKLNTKQLEVHLRDLKKLTPLRSLADMVNGQLGGAVSGTWQHDNDGPVRH